MGGRCCYECGGGEVDVGGVGEGDMEVVVDREVVE